MLILTWVLRFLIKILSACRSYGQFLKKAELCVPENGRFRERNERGSGRREIRRCVHLPAVPLPGHYPHSNGIWCPSTRRWDWDNSSQEIQDTGPITNASARGKLVTEYRRSYIVMQDISEMSAVALLELLQRASTQ